MIWFVGQVFREYREYFEVNGIRYGVLLDKNIKSKLHTDNVIKVDFSTPTSVIESLPKDTSNISGVVAIYEAYVYPASIITNHLDLPGMSTESALACTDKVLMRQAFMRYNSKITPGFVEVGSWAEATKFASSHAFPLILKPANLAKSLLVTKNQNLQELQKNYDYAYKTMADLYLKHRINRQPKLLLEEFLDGSVHSVDAFAESDGQYKILDQVVDYQTGYDIGKKDNYHFSRLLPSNLSKSDQDEIRRVAKIGMSALNLRSTPAHIEIILTSDGPKIVEIGARMGGYRPKMHNFANGIDMFKAMINTSLGKPVDISASANNYCAVLEIFPDTAGQFKAVKNLAKLKSLPSLLSLKIKPKAGAEIGLSSQGYKAAVVIMLGSKDEAEFNKDYNYIKQNVEVIVA